MKLQGELDAILTACAEENVVDCVVDRALSDSQSCGDFLVTKCSVNNE